jgi:hypothetical protein
MGWLWWKEKWTGMGAVPLPYPPIFHGNAQVQYQPNFMHQHTVESSYYIRVKLYVRAPTDSAATDKY